MSNDGPICWYFQQGLCRYGNSCRSRHEGKSVGSDIGAQTQLPSTSSTSGSIQTVQRHTLSSERNHDGGLPRLGWQEGIPGPSSQPPEVHLRRELTAQELTLRPQIYAEQWQIGEDRQHQAQLAAERIRREAVEKAREALQRIRQEQEQTRVAELLHARAAREAEERAKREAEDKARIALQCLREEQERARRAKQAQRQAAREVEERSRAAQIAQTDAAMTTKGRLHGSIVTFGAGLSIRNIATGFESCAVRVRNLPSDAQKQEIYALFTQHGFDVDKLLIVNVKQVGENQEAILAADAESGRALAASLEGVELRNAKLSFEVGAPNQFGGMAVSPARHPDVLSIFWRAPSAKFVIIFDESVDAQEKARELDKRVFRGRCIKAEMRDPPPPGIPANSIQLSNLDVSVDLDDIGRLTGKGATVRPANDVSYDLDSALHRLHTELKELSPGALRSFDCDSGTTPENGIMSVRAHFVSWDEAQKAHDYLKDRKHDYIGNQSFRFCIPRPAIYSIAIPVDQYRAQKSQWDALAKSIKDKKACNMSIRIYHGPRSRARIRIIGSAEQAVGALKVRAETIAAGVSVEGWHPFFDAAHVPFFDHVSQQTGACVRVDLRRRRLKVYGGDVEQARKLIKETLEWLTTIKFSTTLERQSVEFFVREGFAALKDVVGPSNVQFTATTRVIAVTGSEDAILALARLIDTSLTGRHAVLSGTPGQLTCPVCFDHVSHPVRLGCGHIYCTACLRHYLTSAVDSDQFPLLCMGDESRCKTPVPIPTIQHFITIAAFDRLLEVAFATHLTKHPQEFVYCQTPDCTQVYRATTEAAARTLQCPACLTSVCSGCQKDGHAGMSCLERRLQDPAEQERLNEEWIQQQAGNVKRCPRCNIILWKTEGCNHMLCRCGAHICWRCMAVFANNDGIYGHLHAEHGGFWDPGHPNNRRILVNYAEQVEVLRQGRLRLERLDELRREAEEARLHRLELRRRIDELNVQAELELRRRQGRPSSISFVVIPILVLLFVVFWGRVGK
ncbi:hypothetical protein OF83DRAFT_155908 [Amylostereum chailletii]|nr:hypothetical protein OF83DRAFT_155908 [Amylostereum chailletii]